MDVNSLPARVYGLEEYFIQWFGVWNRSCDLWNHCPAPGQQTQFVLLWVPETHRVSGRRWIPVSKAQFLDEAKEWIVLGTQKEQSLTDTLLSTPGDPLQVSADLWDNTFVLPDATKFVISRYSSTMQLKQEGSKHQRRATWLTSHSSLATISAGRWWSQYVRVYSNKLKNLKEVEECLTKLTLKKLTKEEESLNRSITIKDWKGQGLPFC